MWRQRFIDEAGIDQDRLELVFSKELVEVLARPEFARTRIEVLGLSEPKHFKLVRTKNRPDEERLGIHFIPSVEDYNAGRVHRPQIADQVLANLDRDGCVLVLGVGASGKSVLAWLLGLEAAKERRPAYLVDFADYASVSPDTGGALVEELHRFGHPDTLLIFDNCHLERSLAKKVTDAWQDLASSQQPRLLLLGRELRTGRGSLIDSLKLEPLTIKARQPEVLGVYRRLAWRDTGDQPPPEPPPEVLDQWVSTFGGPLQSPDTTADLIAFSAATRRKMPDLLKKLWTLTERDAIEEVRESYLRKLNDGEYHNLMRLCSLQKLEMSLDQQSLENDRAEFEQAGSRLGLVFRHIAGFSQEREWVRYRLAHAALSNLILAAEKRADPVSERLAVALQHPHAGAAMVARLAALGETDEAQKLAEAMLGHPECLMKLGSLQYLSGFLDKAKKLGILLPQNLGEILTTSGRKDWLVEQALNTPVHYLASFLKYASGTPEIKALLTVLATALAIPQNRDKLLQQALQTPLGYLADLLECAPKVPEMEPVLVGLEIDLAQSGHREQLTKQALEMPLHLLPKFLNHAAKSLYLRPVRAALAIDLVVSKTKRSESCVSNPEAPSAAGACSELLTADISTETLSNLEKLIDQALKTPLEGVAFFLHYALAKENVDLRPVYKALSRSCTERRRRWADRFTETGLKGLVALFNLETESKPWDAVLASINIETWNRSRSIEAEPNLEAFVAFQRIVAIKGRPELAQGPALGLVTHPMPARWHKSHIHLNHFAQVLCCAQGASTSEVENFLSQIATPKWVDALLQNAVPEALAGSLLDLSVALEPDQRRWIVRDSLAERVAWDLFRCDKGNTKSWAAALSLLGAATAIGSPVLRTDTVWPEAAILEAILDRCKPWASDTVIGYMQVQLWLGLREMARIRIDPVSVSSQLAEPILVLWRATLENKPGDSVRPRVRALNAGMIAWLECCKAADWRLVPPEAEPPDATPGVQT